MTLPPSRIGEKGQRFEIRWRRRGDAPDSHRMLGWAVKIVGAREMRAAWWQAPDVAVVWIIDRETGKRVS
ncbi:hypothetical protein [Methylocystis sp. S23]